ESLAGLGRAYVTAGLNLGEQLAKPRGCLDLRVPDRLAKRSAPDASPCEVLRPPLPDVDLDASKGDMRMAAHQHAANHLLSSLPKPLLGMPGHVRRHLDRSPTPVQGDRSPNSTPSSSTHRRWGKGISDRPSTLCLKVFCPFLHLPCSFLPLS